MEKRYWKDMRTRTFEISTRSQGKHLCRRAARACLPVALLLIAALPVLAQTSTSSSQGAQLSAGITVAADTSTGADSTQQASSPRQLLNDGLSAFSHSDYSTAILKFRELTIHPSDLAFQPYEGDGYFWVAKTAMALGRLDEAQRNLEYFLMHFQKNSAFVEANYLKGRLLFMQQDFQSAIQVFQKFISQFSGSPFVANAYYWSGEALYDLGHFDEAKKLFLAVVDNYPASYRVEAARYHLSLIDQKRREEELLKLLQWSHEESLRSVDEYQNQIKTYKEAISAYQKKLAGEAGDGMSQEISRLGSQISDLQNTLSQREQTIQDLRKQIADLQSQLQKTGASAAPPATEQPGQSYRQELLDMRGQTEQLQQYLQQQMQQKGDTQ